MGMFSVENNGKNYISKDMAATVKCAELLTPEDSSEAIVGNLVLGLVGEIAIALPYFKEVKVTLEEVDDDQYILNITFHLYTNRKYADDIVDPAILHESLKEVVEARNYSVFTEHGYIAFYSTNIEVVIVDVDLNDTMEKVFEVVEQLGCEFYNEAYKKAIKKQINLLNEKLEKMEEIVTN